MNSNALWSVMANILCPYTQWCHFRTLATYPEHSNFAHLVIILLLDLIFPFAYFQRTITHHLGMNSQKYSSIHHLWAVQKIQYNMYFQSYLHANLTIYFKIKSSSPFPFETLFSCLQIESQLKRNYMQEYLWLIYNLDTVRTLWTDNAYWFKHCRQQTSIGGLYTFSSVTSFINSLKVIKNCKISVSWPGCITDKRLSIGLKTKKPIRVCYRWGSWGCRRLTQLN